MSLSSTGDAFARPARSATTPRIGLVLFALAMGGFAIGTAEFAVMSLLPYFSAGLGVDEPAAGHVISAYAAGVDAGAPIIAVLATIGAPHLACRADGDDVCAQGAEGVRGLPAQRLIGASAFRPILLSKRQNRPRSAAVTNRSGRGCRPTLVPTREKIHERHRA